MPPPLTVKLLLYRFFALLLSFVCNVLIFHTRELSIRVSMPLITDVAQDEVEFRWRDELYIGIWVASLVCHIVQLLGLMLGMNIKRIGINAFSIFCSLMGSFLLVWGSLDAWDYRYFLFIFGLFSFPPALIELGRIFFFVMYEYDLISKIEIRV